ncbi:MAG TPA: YdeI/OmpD-associated family protein [Gemmataceae bacterium]|nr:YdeI/OmpD-associated family protein [Gemmataceae bacterium]
MFWERLQVRDRFEIAMTTSAFIAVIKIRDANPYIFVSAVRANAIKPGWRKPLPVLVRINRKPANAWQINMMPVGNGGFYLYLHGDVRKASGTAVGDRVHVEIDFDTSYRSGPQHPMPPWFKKALAGSPQVMKNWQALIPSRKKEILRYFSRLKSPDARARNLGKALHVLSGEPGRFMARSWKDGS